MIWRSVLLTALLMPAATARPATAPLSDGRTHTVEIRNFAFSPASLEVAVGDTVVWVNRDAAPHTVTDSSGRWDSGEVRANTHWSRAVGKSGRLPYVCTYHPAMRGELIVRRSP